MILFLRVKWGWITVWLKSFCRLVTSNRLRWNLFSDDAFVVLSRARGWWVVRRDSTDLGAVKSGTRTDKWVPAGCFLETSVPVASAIAAAKGSSVIIDPARTPFLLSSFISPNYPVVAFMDHEGKGEGGLNLVEGEQLAVFKRFNHWSYVGI